MDDGTYMEECKLGATMISLSGRPFLRCRFGTWFAGLVGAWFACWFSGVGVPLWCLLSAFIPYPFFLVLAAFGLSHVIVIVIAVFLVGLCLHYVGSHIQLTRGFRCSTSLWLSTNMAGARGFCLFLLVLGFWAAKGFLHLLIQSFCLELGYVMGKRNGEQANVKRVLGV